LIAEQSKRILGDLEQLSGPRSMDKQPMAPARTLIEGKRCKLFPQRLARNGKSLFEEYCHAGAAARSAYFIRPDAPVAEQPAYYRAVLSFPVT